MRSSLCTRPFLRVLLISILAILFLFPAITIAQQDSVSMSAEYYKMGMEVYDFSHRKQAAELFVQAASMNPKNAKAHLMAGKSIMLTINKEKSLSYFLRAMRLDPVVDDDILYYVGQGYHYSEKFDSAILFYTAYNRKLARSLDFEKSVKINKVDRKIFECRNAIVYEAHPVKVVITDLSEKVNSEYPDYAPTITADGSLMIFTSRRPENNANPILAADHEYYEEIYESRKVNGNWEAARLFGEPLNSKYHNASVNIAPDGSEMFIYNDTNGGDIYVTYQHNGIWSKEVSLEGDVNTPALENSAAITRDGQKLFFTSTRPGGYGGTDIFVCAKGKNGKWLEAKNIGPLLNTELDEDGVFVSANGQHLYFSSNGHAGMGDLDLYRSTYDPAKGTWGVPVNLGYPINSPENDIYFVLSDDELTGYFSSVKKENKGEQDIYQVDLHEWQPLDISQLINEANPDPVAQKETAKASSLDLELVVMDANTFALLEANVNLVDENKKLVNVPAARIGNHSIQLPGNPGHPSRYGVKVIAEGYPEYDSHFFMVGAVDKSVHIADTVLLKKAAPVVLSGVLNVYFASNSDTPQSFSDITAIEKLLKENISATVLISGHTDNYGEAAYNMTLSKRRADAVKNYLVKNGISAERVVAEGHGEEMPVGDNATSKGRSMNRRTEFTILNYNSNPKLKKDF